MGTPANGSEMVTILLNIKEFKKTMTTTSCRTPPNNSNNREFKKTLTTTSCRTPPNNSVNEQNNETARAKYSLAGFFAVLCKTTTSNEHFPSFVDNVVVRR